MNFLSVIGFLAVLVPTVNAHAYEVYPPNKFQGRADNGIQVGCILSGKDVFGAPTFNCRFAQGAISLVVTEARFPSDRYTCGISSQGELGECLPAALYYPEMLFYIKTDSVDTGFVSCKKSAWGFGSWENLHCAASYNGEAGPNGMPEGWQNLVDCLTEGGQRILLQTIDHDLKDGSWRKDDFVLNAFDSVSRAYTIGGTSSDGKRKVSPQPDILTETRFVAGRVNLTLSKPIAQVENGTIIGGTYNDVPVSCIVNR